MCGIAGIVSKSGFNPGLLQKMNDSQKHRGPDDEGYYAWTCSGEEWFLRGNDTIPELSGISHIGEMSKQLRINFGLAHRRLSILDLSPAGHQPMKANGSSAVIVYNGEVYNYKEIRSELTTLGRKFGSDTDTEIILSAYAAWGEACVDRFMGMWAYALWNKNERKLFISRDRFGIKPLYFYHKDNVFAFASEIKTLLELDFISRNADLECVYDYMALGSIVSDEKTFFQNVCELPPGNNLVYDFAADSLVVRSYYDLSVRVKNITLFPDQKRTIESYHQLLSESVALHLRSDVPVGACLSGGLDSGSIVALSVLTNPRVAFQTFTAAYPSEAIDESQYAHAVASRFKNVVSHFTFPSAEGFLRDFERLAWHQDLPFSSTSIYAQWEVMKKASEQKMKVLLDGQGADESLGGYAYFAGIYLLGLINKFQIVNFFRNAKQLSRNRSIHVSNELGRALYYRLPNSWQSRLQRKMKFADRFLSADFIHQFRQRRAPKRIGKTLIVSSVLGFKYGLRELLRYEDRNSMAFSIESRVPFLDHRLVEFSISLADDWKFHEGWSKYILRKSGEPNLPPEVVWRKDKLGFVTPEKKWLAEIKTPLQNYFCSIKMPEFFRRENIRSMLYENISSSKQVELFKILSFIKWGEMFKVQF